MSNRYPIHIKHMVCPRCIKAVEEEIINLGLGMESINLGEVVLKARPDDGKLQALKENLKAQGFEIISDHKSSLINQIKMEVIKVIHHREEMPGNMTFSSYLADKITVRDYIVQKNLDSTARVTRNLLPKHIKTA